MTSIFAALFLTLGIGFSAATAIPVARPVLPPGEYDAFAQCLTDSNIVKYGTATCPHCQRQKALFGNSWQYINDVECADNRELCEEQSITGYPTWVFYDENGKETKRLLGTQSLAQLSEESSCPLQ